MRRQEAKVGMKLPHERKLKLRTLNGNEPHPDWGGWGPFLAACEVRDRSDDGVVFYGHTNCNYIVWPNGIVVCNYGYHGRALMNEIKDEGKNAVLAKIRAAYREFKALLSKLGTTDAH